MSEPDTDAATRPVVAGTDGSGSAVLAVSWAAEEAWLRNAPLWLCAVPDPVHPAPVQARRTLERATAVARVTAPGAVAVTMVRHGDPARVLAALSRSAQLTVVGHRGAGRGPSVALGSVAATLARTCPAPLVVVRFAPGHPVPDRARPVIAGVDGTANDAAVLEHAASVAQRRGATLHAVHVWPEHLTGALARLGHRERLPGRVRAERLLDDAVADVAGSRPGLEILRTVIRGNPAWSLLELSDSAQLLVVGAAPRHGVRARVPGPVTTTLVQASGCPVAVVPPGVPDERSPAYPVTEPAPRTGTVTGR